MNEYQNPLEISDKYISNEHGLCEAAETHWGIYLIQAIKQGKKLTPHTAVTTDGKTINYLIKGENKEVTGFTFGAESMLIYKTDISESGDMVAIQESDDKWFARPTVSLAEALRLNDFDDPDLPSRWKDVINDYAKQKNISPYDITLNDLLVQVV